MINLLNDYSLIAHPNILKSLNNYSEKTFIGYGTDEITNAAKDKIKHLLKSDSEIQFLVGGTITNKVAIAHMLKPYEAIIACDTAHINVHETGAIESLGHKILTVPNHLGKIAKEDILKIYQKHQDEHMVKPKMVYISDATEFGTIYSLNELKELKKLCEELKMYLYLDGARLSVALTAKTSDVTLADLAKYTDMFYIGGTKNGLLFGEALVINNEELKKDIRYTIKQQGAMLSKGFLNGIQFNELFTDDLIFKIGKYQNELAYLFKEGLDKLHISLYQPLETNQVFVILSKQVYNKIKDQILCEVWEEREKDFIVRFVTNYATTKDDIEKSLEIIRNAK